MLTEFGPLTTVDTILMTMLLNQSPSVINVAINVEVLQSTNLISFPVRPKYAFL